MSSYLRLNFCPPLYIILESEAVIRRGKEVRNSFWAIAKVNKIIPITSNSYIHTAIDTYKASKEAIESNYITISHTSSMVFAASGWNCLATRKRKYVLSEIYQFQKWYIIVDKICPHHSSDSHPERQDDAIGKSLAEDSVWMSGEEGRKRERERERERESCSICARQNTPPTFSSPINFLNSSRLFFCSSTEMTRIHEKKIDHYVPESFPHHQLSTDQYCFASFLSKI